CLRCGHQWRSFSYLRLPRSCARCGSTYWNDEPVAPGARHPEDPPNPRWRKRTVPRKRAFPPASITAASPVERHVAAQRAGLTPPPPLPQALAAPQPESFVSLIPKLEDDPRERVDFVNVEVPSEVVETSASEPQLEAPLAE